MATKEKEKDKEKKGEAKGEPPQAAAPKKSKKKLLILLAGVVLLLAGGGGGAWYFMRPKPGSEADAAKAPEKPVEKKAAPKADKSKPPVFVALETFTVNLQAESGERFLQTSLSLKVADAPVGEAIKLRMPEIRSRLLLLLSSKKPSELASVEGKQALANQIADEVNRVLNPDAEPAKPAGEATKSAEGAGKPPAPVEGPVQSVLFTNFIIQ